jgi:hypothetical protein
MDTAGFTGRSSRLADRSAHFHTVQPSFADVFARLESPDDFPAIESFKLFEDFFSTNSLNQFPACDQVIHLLLELIARPETFEKGIRFTAAILCRPTFSMSEELASNLIQLLKPGRLEESALEVLKYICGIHPELFMQEFPLCFWCDEIRSAREPEVLQGLLKVVAREIRALKNDVPITDPDFSMALVGVLDGVLAAAGDEKRIISGVVDVAHAFAIRNVCWLTFFKEAELIERLFQFFHLKSSTTRIKLLKLAEEAYKQGASPDVFDVSLLVRSLGHSVACIQNAAIDCIIVYVRCFPRRLRRLVDLGLCQALLDVISDATFATRCHAIDLLAELVISDEAMVEVFLDEDVITAILPFMRDSANSRTTASLLTVLKRMRNFCVLHGQGRFFVEKFDECEGYEVIDGLSKDVRDGLVAEEARVFVEEVAYLERAVQ